MQDIPVLPMTVLDIAPSEIGGVRQTDLWGREQAGVGRGGWQAAAAQQMAAAPAAAAASAACQVALQSQCLLALPTAKDPLAAAPLSRAHAGPPHGAHLLMVQDYPQMGRVLTATASQQPAVLVAGGGQQVPAVGAGWVGLLAPAVAAAAAAGTAQRPPALALALSALALGLAFHADPPAAEQALGRLAGTAKAAVKHRLHEAAAAAAAPAQGEGSIE